MTKTRKYLKILYALILIFLTSAFAKDGEAEMEEMSANHSCLRICVKDQPKTCYYKFEIEHYVTMSKACYNCPFNVTDCYRRDCIAGDGVKRVVTVVNRTMPGPDIQVCEGDMVVVDVVNKMTQESTTIHWHGIHQKGSPYMDGVPYITQCPIPPGVSFQYKFIAESGTHFWHSHLGCQRTDGVYGALIVRKPIEYEFLAPFYDQDLPHHIIKITDWIHETTTQKMMYHFHTNGNNKPDTILVNGRGSFQEFQRSDGVFLRTPVTIFNIQKGKRYRFRLINAGFLNCPIEMSIDGHQLIVLATDGFPIQPIEVESLVSYAGERWDFVLTANNNASNYWMRFRGLLDCDERFQSAFGSAVLHYKGAAKEYPLGAPITYNNSLREGLQLNALNKGSGEFDFVTVAEMSNYHFKKDQALKLKPDLAVMLAYDFYDLDNPLFHKTGMYGYDQVKSNVRVRTPQINHISFAMPPFPLLSEPEYMDFLPFCNDSKLQNCEEEFCHCTYTINLPLNAVVEIILLDIGIPYEANHPFHLHGHAFRVVALEKIGNSTSVAEFKALDSAGLVKRNLHNAPMKDTVTVPDGGFSILRLHATNPGFWLLHCHLDLHVEIGMAVVFKVGELGDYPPPPMNFPKCGQNFFYGIASRVSDDASIHTLDGDRDPNFYYQYNITRDKQWFSMVNWFHKSSVSRRNINTFLLCIIITIAVLF